MSKVRTVAEHAEATGIPLADLTAGGWKATDRVCAQHGTGYDRFCLQCAALAEDQDFIASSAR